MSFDLKKCRRCGEEKVMSEFPKYTSADGTVHYRPRCKICYSAASKMSSKKYREKNRIPRSMLPYASMEDSNFKRCWALENLRPLSAKRNYLDGVHKTRHGGD
jgi:hypothetical protein